MDATRTTRHLEETIDNFEKQKIKDIKTIFSEFITIEMLFHGKALEVYTAAYQNIQKIDEEEDLEVGLCLSKLSSSTDMEIFKRNHPSVGKNVLNYTLWFRCHCMQFQIAEPL